MSAAATLRPIWLCADDYGIAPGVNSAIRDLVVRRRLNATSVMVVAPSFDRSEAAALNVLNAGEARVAIGLHLVLTAPFRPLSDGFEPRHDGAFAPLAKLLVDACLLRLNSAALRAEIDAQLVAFRDAFGRMPEFIDGHQHVQLFPQVREAVIAAVQASAPGAWLRQCGRVTSFLSRWDNGKALLLDMLSHRFRRRTAAAGLRTNPAFAGAYAFDERADFARLFSRFLDRLPEGGVVMCHPGFVDAQLQSLDPLTALREREYRFFVDDAFPAMLTNHGLTLSPRVPGKGRQDASRAG